VDLQQVSAAPAAAAAQTQGYLAAGDRPVSASALTAAMAARYAVPVVAGDTGSTSTDDGSAGARFRHAIYRVLIALVWLVFPAAEYGSVLHYFIVRLV